MAQRNLEIPKDSLAEFCERNHILTLALFGSVLRDDFHDGSDIDMLVEFDPEARVGYLAQMRIQRELSEIFGRSVDLRTGAELSPYIRQPVLDSAQMQYVHR